MASSETGWMTRQEAADYLKVSTRQLDRLRLPRTLLGSSPRYSRAILDEHLEGETYTPGQRKRGGPRPPLRLDPRVGPTDVKAELAKLRRRLGY